MKARDWNELVVDQPSPFPSPFEKERRLNTHVVTRKLPGKHERREDSPHRYC
jgi:hypothetical protein